MSRRYERPAALPPNPAFLEAYLRDARPTWNERLAEPDATETRRVKGVAALLALARAALVEVGDPNRLLAIPSRLRGFLTIQGLRILTAEDPIAALQRFLGQQPKGPGRPAADDHDYRDFLIAADVAELHEAGMTLNAAYEEITKQPGTPGVRAIERIYFRLRKDLAVRAELALRRMMMAERTTEKASAPPPEIEGQEIRREQWEEYSALVAVECPSGMTVEDNLELWSFVRRASFPH